MTDFARHIWEETSKLTTLATPEKAEKLEKYYEMVLEYNEKVNLTAITKQEDFLQKHYLDSLALIADQNVSRETLDEQGNRRIWYAGQEEVTVEETADAKKPGHIVSRETMGYAHAGNVSRETLVRSGTKIMDVGTGAGFPGIPLAIFREDLRVTLLDSLNKRVFFLENTIKELGLSKCSAIHGRAEDLAHQEKYRETYDICVSRAVAALPVLCEFCLPFVRKGGYFVSYKATGAETEVKAAEKAMKVLGGKIHAIHTVHLPGTDLERKLIVIKKVENTPKNYPRKAGTPAKSPL